MNWDRSFTAGLLAQVVEDLLRPAEETTWEGCPFEDPPFARATGHVVPEYLRRLYVATCELGEISSMNLRLVDKTLGQTDAADDGAVLVLGQHLTLGSGNLARKFSQAQELFWLMLSWDIPAISEKTSLAVGADWQVVEIDDPTGL